MAIEFGDKSTGDQYFEVTCDAPGCDRQDGDYYLSFGEFIEEIRQTGWQIYRHHGEWHHKCPACSTRYSE